MKPATIRLAIVVLGLLLFVPTLGSVHLFDWDEINFAECAREMIVRGDYLHVTVDYAPFHEKPPLFIWLQALSMLAFGVNETAARLPNVFIGIATLLVIFNIGIKLFDQRFATLWVLAYVGSILPQFYMRSAIIDPLFNLFIFLSLHALYCSRERPYSMYLAGLYSGLAVLTKGPVGFGLIMLTLGITWFIQRKQQSFPLKSIVIVTVLTVLVAGSWLAVDFVTNGPQFVLEHLAYQYRLLTTGEAGHAQPFYYHALVLLVGCYPASILFIGAMRSDTSETDGQRSYRILMLVLFFVVLVVFSIVKTKIVHYSSMTYVPMTFLAALALHRWMNNRQQLGTLAKSSLVVLATLWTLLTAAIPLAFINSQWMLGLSTFRDPFLRASLLQNVAWTGYEPLISILLVTGCIVALVFMRDARKRMASLFVLFGSVVCFVSLFLPLVAPKIERYTQGAAVDFYASLRDKSAYVKPLTMKSYAHLFYSEKPYELSATAKGIAPDAWEPWLLNGAIDKPAYFVARINDAGPWRTHQHLRIIGEHGGFVFFQRINDPK